MGEQLYDKEDLVFLPVRANDAFAKSFANLFGIDDPDKLVKNTVYGNGEYCPTITGIIQQQGKNLLEDKVACIISDYTSEVKPTEQIGKISILSNAAKHAGAKDIILIMAEHFFDRQDHNPDLIFSKEYEKTDEAGRHKINQCQGQPYTAEVLPCLFRAAGITKVITVSAHSQILTKEYKKEYGYDALYNLDPVPIFIDYSLKTILKSAKGKNLILVAPDKGAAEMVNRFYSSINMPDAAKVFFGKWRTEPNNPSKLKVEKISPTSPISTNKKMIIAMDDKIDTGGTFIYSVIGKLVKESALYGPPYQVHLLAAHAILPTLKCYEDLANNRINLHCFNTHPNLAFKKSEPAVEHIFLIDITKYFAYALVNHVIPEKPLDNSAIMQNAGQFYEVMKLERKTALVNY
ncbi:hypothetical protein HZB88_01825 [archaeon]|nr:hypothetical protein [archaeon]